MREGLAIRAGLVLNGGIAVALLTVWLGMARQGLFWQADFTAFYIGWSMVLDGQGERLYDLDRQRAYQSRIVPERGPGAELLPFISPPHFALAGAWLGLFPRDIAFFVWFALQAGLLLVLLTQLCWFARGRPPDERLLLVATVLAFPPVLLTFQLGQVSILLTVCLAGWCLGLERRQTLVPAAWFALGTIKPQLFVIPGLILLVSRNLRVLSVLVVLMLPWLGLTTLVLGPRCWTNYLAVVRHAGEQFGTAGVFPTRMYSLKASLAGLLGSENASLVNALTLLGLVVACGVTVLVWTRRQTTLELRLRLAVCLQLGMLTNPHFNPHDALAFAVPAVLWWTGRTGRPWASLAGIFLVACPVLFLIDCYAMAAWPGGVRPFFVLMVLLAGWMFADLRANGPAT